MTTFSDQGTERTLMIGAPEVILDMSALVWKRDGAAPLDPAERRVLDEHMHLFSTQGLRVIGLAESSEDGVTFVGFVAMQDALRPEVPLAVQKAKDAGMRVVMITGDHAITAEAIARQAGIFVDGDKVLTGHDMTHMSDEILQERVVGVTVFARVAPQHKMRIIKAFKARGEIIAMTGDGVNDVPSLVAADLGVAMGIVGTEVAKDAADIVLLDDDFGNISRAVEEGRHIYATLKRTLVYLFSTNLAELLVIMFGVLVIMRIPLIPAQIIWLNLVTDSFLVMTLAFLPRMTQDLNKDAHKKHPRYILDMPTFLRMVFFALIITGGTLAVFIAYLGQGIEVARTMVFVTLALFQIFRLLTIQSDTTSVFTVNPFAHRLTFFAVLGALALQSFAVYTPFMQKIFETVPLSFYEWLIALAVASSIIFFEEVRKFFVRRSEA
ncbi:MAG: HAD-IC family P-type ATPase [Candidatus Pacebacteria bacterium]|nr:HAD-IC family P-type ATPase [Candidatus Paceibacterota bacterium]